MTTEMARRVTSTHEHTHRGGVLGAIRHLIAPHSHDHTELIDSATATREGSPDTGPAQSGDRSAFASHERQTMSRPGRSS
jgi:hypothetical protein